MIREAIIEDMPSIVKLGAEFFNETCYKDIVEFDEESFKTTVSLLSSSPDGCVLIKESDGKIIGLIMGMLYPLWFNHNHKTAQELVWYVLPEYRGTIAGVSLFKEMETRLKNMGAKSISMVYLDSVNPEKVKKVYSKLGYRASEHTYIKGVL